MVKVYEYSNYRSFLSARYEELKVEQPGFTYRKLAKVCGFKSPGFYHLIVSGKRNLTNAAAQKLAKGLGLEHKETIYFCSLVKFNQSTSLEERAEAAKKILELKQIQSVFSIGPELMDYYKNWYYPVIREMVRLNDFQELGRWIVDCLQEQISVFQAREALESLENMGFLKRENGKLKQSHAHVKTPDEAPSILMANFHYQMIKFAAESIANIHHTQRDISGLTLTVSKSMLPEMKKLIADFRASFIKLASQSSEHDSVYQVNVQLFPLTKDADTNTKS